MNFSHLMAFSILFFLIAVSFADGKNQIPESCDAVIAGAGIGGAYAAYRLAVDSKKFPADRICVFEARPHAGGRLQTVRSAIPGFQGYTIDLGAYRYSRQLHHIVASIAESILNIQYLCYFDPFPTNFPECSTLDNGLRIWSSRGKNYPASPTDIAETRLTNYTDSNGISVPYNIRPEFQWSESGNLTSARSPYSFLFGADSPLPSISTLWPRLLETQDYETAMNIADKMIRLLRTTTLSKQSILQYAMSKGYTAEELQYTFDRTGTIADGFHRTITERATYDIRNTALSKRSINGTTQLVTPADIINGMPRRIGMDTLVYGLLHRAQAKGVKVFYNAQLMHISRDENKKGHMNVKILDKKSQKNKLVNVNTKAMFLNIPKNELVALGTTSEPILSGRAEFKKQLSRVTGITLSKMYCFWDDAWWITKLNYTKGEYRTADETLFGGRYHDGDVTCTGSLKNRKCRGALLVSYIRSSSATAATVGMSFHAQNPRMFAPYMFNVQGNARKVFPYGKTKKVFEEIHRQIRKSHKETFENFGLDVEKDLEDAKGCVYSDWLQSGMHYQIGPFGPKVMVNKLFSKPVNDLDISLTNEAFSDVPGWAEGSVRGTERALYHVHGLPKPVWMDTRYHESIIKKFNSGL